VNPLIQPSQVTSDRLMSCQMGSEMGSKFRASQGGQSTLTAVGITVNGALLVGWLLTAAGAGAGWARWWAQKSQNKELKTQNALLERRLAAEEADRADRRSADVRIVNYGRSSLNMRVTVQNFGPALADEVAVDLIRSEDGVRWGSCTLGRPLAPGGKPVDLLAAFPEGVSASRPEVEIVLRWKDSESREIRLSTRL
jgi:hypothetical protein